MNRNSYKIRITLTLLIILALLYRLDFLFPHNFIIDSDEAIVGLMAKHILDGKGVPTFYYGQHYMGSLEAIMAAIAFKLFGINNFALKLPALIFSLFLIPVGYALGVRLGGRTCGLITASFFALPPVALAIWSAKARGGFVEILVIGAIALILFNDWFNNKDKLWRLYLACLLLGVGWWTNNQIIYFMLPIFIFAFIYLIFDRSKQFKFRFKTMFIGFIIFLLGGAPYWIYNIKNNFVSFKMFTAAKSEEVYKHFERVLDQSLPIIMGAKNFWSDQDIFPGSSTYYLIFLVFGLIYLGIKNYKNLLTSFLPQKSSNIMPALLLILFFGAIYIFVKSSYGYLTQAPRYLLPIYISTLPILAYFVTGVFKANRIVGILFQLTVISLHLISAYYPEKALPGEPMVFEGQRVSKCHLDLVNWLKENKINKVRTNYWIGYRLAFETNETVKFVIFGQPGDLRIPEYEQGLNLQAVEQLPMVLVSKQWKLIKLGFEHLGFNYEVKDLSGYKVIYNIKKEFKNIKIISGVEITANSSDKNEIANLALDNNPETRWGTGRPQAPDMWYKLEFEKPTKLSAVQIYLGRFSHDYPRGLRIVAETADGSQKRLVTQRLYRSLRYYTANTANITFNFEPIEVKKIKFTQTASDPIFDWSMAEIVLYENS